MKYKQVLLELVYSLYNEKENNMINIEISYTTDEDEFPEHYGYYDNFEDAKEALEHIEKILESDK